MGTDMHPDELDLMEFIDGNAGAGVRQHILHCQTCQRAVDETADVGDLPSGVAPQQVDVHVTPLIVEALGRELPRQARPGQLWRVRWDHDAVLAVIVSADRTTCRLAPVSLDVHLAGPEVIICEAADSPVGVAVGLWTTQVVDARVSLLERYLGDFGADVVAQIAAADSFTDPEDATSGLSALDDRTVFAGRLRDALAGLGRVSWMS